MQHPPELKTKFLELRARGIPYSRIAEELSVSKPTLIHWGKSMAEEIADLKAAERELIREKLLGNFEQWLGRQVHHFNRLDEEFGRREFKYSPTESVFRMMMASRKVLDRYFFEDDKPSRRDRAAALPAAACELEGRVPSSPLPQTLRSSSLSLLPSLENPSNIKSNETERSQQNLTTGSRNTNDLQQPDSKSFDSSSAPPESETSLNPQPPTLNQPENPAKTQPFTSQNSGRHKPNLSSVVNEGRAMCPHSAESLYHNRNPNPPSARPHLCVELPANEELRADDPALESESTRDIAGNLNLSVKTAEVHRLNIKSKLELTTAAELFTSPCVGCRAILRRDFASQ